MVYPISVLELEVDDSSMSHWPPLWFYHANILVDDVCNLRCAAWFAVRVAFNVNPFPRPWPIGASVV